MKLNHIVMDEFFENPHSVRREMLSREFKDVTSPFDGGIYPNIAEDLPTPILKEFLTKAEIILRSKIARHVTVCRATTKGYDAYQYAHHDLPIASWTAVVYLNETFPRGSGTALLRGRLSKAETDLEDSFLKEMTNVPTAWDRSGFAAMKFNRAIFFPACLYHQAIPLKGFGEKPENARLVFVSWFDLAL